MRFNQIDAKISAVPNIGATMNELDRLKITNQALLEALRLAEAELRLIVEECQDNNETHKGCEAAVSIAQLAILEAGGQPIEFGVQ
jgi:hypothetical protein